MIRLGGTLATAVAIGVGFLTTLSLLLDGTGILLPLLQTVDIAIGAPEFGVEQAIRSFLPVSLDLVVVTVALTIFIGLFNLLGVHTTRVIRRQHDAVWSLLLIISAVGVLVIVVAERTGVLQGAVSYSDLLLITVQNSIEASLAGLLAFSLVFGAYQMLRTRLNLQSTLFVIALVLSLLIQAGLAMPAPIETVRNAIVDAGADGILLGITLATLVAGVRVLIGQDRSYRQ